MRTRTLAALRQARKISVTSDHANFDLIMLAIRGKTVGFEKVIALIDTMVETLKKEQLDDDHKKEYCEGQFDTSAKELLLFAKNRLNKFYNPKLYKAPPKRVLG